MPNLSAMPSFILKMSLKREQSIIKIFVKQICFCKIVTGLVIRFALSKLSRHLNSFEKKNPRDLCIDLELFN